METSPAGWKDFFCKWPDDVPRRGMLITSFGEQIPFAGFMTSEAFLLLDRQTPDSLGARTIVLGYDTLSALKLTEVLPVKSFRVMGFAGPASKRS